MSDYIDRWLGLGDKKPDPTKMDKEALEGIDRFDREDHRRIAKEFRDYRTAEDALCEIAETTGHHLFGDTFHAFHKVVVGLKDEAKMNPNFLINRKVEEQMLSLPEYERHREWTEADIVGAGIACVDIEPELEQLFDKTKTQQEAAAALEQQMLEYLQAEGRMRTVEEVIDAWGDQDDFDPEAASAARQAAQDALDAAAEALRKSGSDLEGEIESGVRSGMTGVRAKMAESANDMQAQAQAAQAWGIDPGELRRMDAKQRVELAQRLQSPKFKRIAELWGPMHRIAFTEQTRKVYHANEEVYDISTGNDLARVLPMEFASLRHPVLKRDFYRKYTERQLLQYEMQGTEKVGKGAIIQCIDSSGSMDGEPDMWAKAVGLCSLDIAKEQKRAFHGFIFGSARELTHFDFSTPDLITPDRVMDWAEFFYGGGTDFMTPLGASLALLEREYDQKGYVEGDIVLVTDGICGVTDQWLAMFKERQEVLGFKVWGILIGSLASLVSHGEHYKKMAGQFLAICDGNIIEIAELLKGGDDIRGVFRSL